jgi:hypothetical protein
MNKILCGLLVITALVSVFFLGKACLGTMGYFSLDGKTKAFVDSWQMEEKDPAAFSLKASYHFFIGKEKILGQTEFMKPYFLNKESAEKAIKKLSSQEWEAFYSSSKKQKNSLQRAFPFQDCIHAFLTLGILVYFIFLKQYLKRLSV